jgi:hypothetical protein
MRKTTYRIEKILPQLGKRDSKKILNSLNDTSLSVKEKNRISQIANAKSEAGLERLVLGYQAATKAEVIFGEIQELKTRKNAYLQIIKLNKSSKGKKALLQCLGYDIMKPLLKKCFQLLEKKSAETALNEFEKKLVSNSKVVLELNGRRYVEGESLKKCLNATPQELRKLEVLSQDSHYEGDKKLFPIDGILRTVGVCS